MNGTGAEKKIRNYKIDMCSGPLLGKIILFTMPLMFTYILQLLFNAVDLVVIGHYAPHQAMAAVGATLNLNALVLNLFIGISIGTNVLAAKFFGAKDETHLRQTVHTSIAVALYGGGFLMIIGLLAAKPLLVLMKTPPEILPMSCTYIWICFCAIPFIMLYNFGCAIFRAVGDTRRPLLILVLAGLLNVLLNLFFVIVCGMDVGGVALATAISHGLSAALILKLLLNARDACRLEWRKIRFDGPIFRDILKIGIPAGIQNSCFAISNMLIQSSINSFGSLAMAGTTAAIGLEGIVYVGSYSFHQAAISFVAQNYGGGKFKRVQKSLYWCFLCGVVCCSAMGAGFYLLGRPLLALFNPNPQVIAWGLLRMKMMFPVYGICGIMDVASGGLRGLGYSLTSAVISLLGACVFRVWWVMFVFPLDPTMEMLVLSYPVSWALVALVGCVILYWVCRKIIRQRLQRIPVWSSMRPGIPRGLRYLGGAK